MKTPRGQMKHAQIYPWDNSLLSGKALRAWLSSRECEIL